VAFAVTITQLHLCHQSESVSPIPDRQLSFFNTTEEPFNCLRILGNRRHPSAGRVNTQIRAKPTLAILYCGTLSHVSGCDNFSVDSPMPSIKKRMVYLIASLVVLSPLIALAVLSALATKPKNLGGNNSLLAPCPNSPNCVSTQNSDDQHTIEAIVFDGPPEDAMRKLKAVLAVIPRMEIITETESYIHAEATSLIFRFRDDVEFFIDQQSNLIHFRSASRVGKSDLGANRKRMEEIRTAFKQQ